MSKTIQSMLMQLHENASLVFESAAQAGSEENQMHQESAKGCKNESGTDPNDEPIGESAVFDDMIMAEAVILMMQEAGYAHADGVLKNFLIENSHILEREGLMTEAAAGGSFQVLSREAQKEKAIKLLTMHMARKAGDSRAIKIQALRRKLKKLTAEVQADSRYAGPARQAVSQKQFTYAPSAQATATRQAMQGLRLK